MKLYSDYRGRRTRQIIADLAALVGITAWIWLGVSIYGLVMNLRDFGVQMADAGAGFRQTMTEVSGSLSEVPLIGSGIRAPFDGASDAGAALESAGLAQQVAVQQLATGLGVGIAVLPVLTILLLWLIPRLRFAHRASTTKALISSGASVDLLALRALSRQKIQALATVDADPAGAWRRGDPAVIRALASLETRSSGIRLDPLSELVGE